ncbi:hypothetical protein RJ639_012163 [Escallonia herrerae]|uniref:Uncharacterized protein n=1 Tax=Escallonia herrerae TaxID=1293975 RepID=A0AA89AQB8_9ASTE|nr:hypothetical protein RJ639_012163 [Escallonia herrerae]
MTGSRGPVRRGAGGPLLAILGFLIFPFIWSVPEVLITAELSTAFPGNGGFVIWAHPAFGPFFGSLLGTWKFLCGVINIASFPVLCIDYLEKLFPVFASGLPRKLAILISTLFLSFVNYTGLAIVGYAAVGLGVVSLLPFIIMSLTAIPQIHPHRWVSLGQQGVKKVWNLFFNTLFWNLNFWDNVSTMAGEVEKPQKTFPTALFSAVILTCFAYILPLLAVTGAVTVDQSEWESGFMANAAQMISGKWLKMGLFCPQLGYWKRLGYVVGIRIICLVEDFCPFASGSDEAARTRDNVPDSICVPDIYHGNRYQDCSLGEWAHDRGCYWVLFKKLIEQF